MTPELIVYPEQLRKAREAVSLSIEEAARQVGVEARTLQAWETGSEEPDVEALEALSQTYARSLDYFLSRKPDPLQHVYLRTKRSDLTSNVSLESRQTIAKFEELCRAEWELERVLGLENTVQFSPQSNQLSAEELASVQREQLTLDAKPIKNLRDLLGKLGIRVFVLAIPGNEFSGLSSWHPEYGPAMLVNASEGPGRRNFTMAHEFGHLLMGALDGVVICDLSDIDAERFANKFAVAFLMPAEGVRRFWFEQESPGDGIDAAFLGTMARYFAVSPEALAIRLDELDLTKAAKAILESSAQPRSYGRRRPDWRRTRGERFLRKAFRAFNGGKISRGKLAEYLGTDLRTALRIAEETGGSRQ